MSIINYQTAIQNYDSHKQFDVLKSFPAQLQQGLTSSSSKHLSAIHRGRIANVIVCGMGGSAISGDILRTVASGKASIPIVVIRGYRLPNYVGANTLVVAMSYSGSTEETLSAYTDAVVRGAQIVCITAGGELLKRAEADGHAVVPVPGGLAPRHALGYLFGTLAGVCDTLEIFSLPNQDQQMLLHDVEARVLRYSNYTLETNEAIQLAEKLHGTIPVVYAAQDPMDAVVMRWRCQIEENAKMLSYSNVFPEMNHNEIVGWEQNPNLLKHIAVITLHDRDELPQIRTRIHVTLDLLRECAAGIFEVEASEALLLSRVLGSICLGDWMSFYLAIGTQQDPFPIAKIDALKAALAR